METYSEYLKDLKRRQTNYKNFSESEVSTRFLVPYELMEYDYEFIYERKRKNINTDKLYSDLLVFEKISNDLCIEISTGLAFHRSDEDDFYNDRTGLYFNFNKDYCPVSDPQCVFFSLEEVFDYYRQTMEYISHYEDNMRKDVDKRAKSQMLLLNQSKIFTDEE